MLTRQLSASLTASCVYNPALTCAQTIVSALLRSVEGAESTVAAGVGLLKTQL